MYQVAWLGDRYSEHVTALSTALEAGMRDLGVEPDAFLQTSRDVEFFDWRNPAVGVWLAGESPAPLADLTALSRLLNEGCPVFPVVEKLEDFRRLIPESLHTINGFEWRADPARLTAEILRALGLSREQRTAFISYRRSDSRGVAVQFFHRMIDHGYRAFLDTASVDYGVKFQETLWDRMSDADLLIFLDTPGALSSQWVEAELTRANNLGLGILQTVWPDWKPFHGTELCTRFLLAETDFRSGSPPYLPDPPHGPNPEGALVEEAFDSLVAAAERVRMRSLGSRRARIVGEIVDSATRRGLRATVTPGGPVTLSEPTDETSRSGKALPVVGLPSAECIFNGSSCLAPGGDSVRLVYDGLGMSPERIGLISWLNQQVPAFRTLPVMEIDAWLDQL